MNKAFLEEIGLDEDQIALLWDRLEKESRYRKILGSEHVLHIEDISSHTDVTEIDLDNEKLLRLKIRTEFAAFIPKAFKCQK